MEFLLPSLQKGTNSSDNPGPLGSMHLAEWIAHLGLMFTQEGQPGHQCESS